MTWNRTSIWLAAGVAVALTAFATAALLIWDASGAMPPIDQQPGAASSGARTTGATLREAADSLANQPNDDATMTQLEGLYAGLCDPDTGEPNPGGAGPAIQRVAMALRDIAANHPPSARRSTLLGDYALAAGLNSVAIAALRDAAAHGATPDMVVVPLSLALLRADRLEELDDTIDPSTVRNPLGRSHAFDARARAEIALGRYDVARASLNGMQAARPDSMEAISRLGFLELSHGSREAAAKWLARARAVDAKAPATLRLAGEYLFATGDYAASAATYERLLGMTVPASTETISPDLGRVRALIYLGDVRQATSALDASRLPANDPMAGYYRALVAYRSGAYGKAHELAEGLEGHLPKFPQLDLLLGASLLATGFPQSASHYLARYMEAVPGNSHAHQLQEISEAPAEPDRPAPVPAAELSAAFGFPESSANTVAARHE